MFMSILPPQLKKIYVVIEYKKSVKTLPSQSPKQINNAKWTNVF